ncbi:MAG TPA: polyprenyl synthetase family protein [Anaerolineales bacterium]
MDFHSRALELLLELPVIKAWPDMQQILRGTAFKKPRDWKLPVIGCQAVGSRIEDAIPAVAAVACLQISIILIDDLLDNDLRGEHHRLGVPQTANLAASFQAAGLEAALKSEAEPAIKMAVLECLVQMLQTTCLGQNLDVQNLVDEEDYWRLVRTKSSPFFATALGIGSLLGGAKATTANHLNHFGRIYGGMIQIHDDLNDVMAVPANSDWLLCRSPLPILYSKVVDHPDRETFFELLKVIPDPAALTEAQTILIRCGAVSYCLDQILRRYQTAHRILGTMSLYRKEGLEDLLDDVIEPVKKIFEFAGLQPSADLLNPPDIAH